MAENGHQAKAIDFAKSSLLKMHKNMLKTFLQHIAVVLCKKRLEKTANNWRNESILKMAQNGHQAKAIDYAKSSLWLKN